MTSPDYNNIDDYLLNNLTDPEMKLFEQRLAVDKELATALEERRDLMTVVDIMGDIRMKERVRRLRQTVNVVEMPPKRGIFPWPWAIAAVLVLAAGVSVWLWMRPSGGTEPAQIYAEYYEPYNLNFGTRSTDTEQQLADAGTLYKAGKYAEALPIFESVLVQNPTESKARLAAGICHLELGKNGEALATFKPLIDADDPLFSEQALWYSALATIKNGDMGSAKQLLEKFTANEESQFHEKAVDILKEL